MLFLGEGDNSQFLKSTKLEKKTLELTCYIMVSNFIISFILYCCIFEIDWLLNIDVINVIVK